MKKKLLILIACLGFIIIVGCSKKNEQIKETQQNTEANNIGSVNYSSDSVVVKVNGEDILYRDIEPFINAILEQEYMRWQMVYNSMPTDDVKNEIKQSIQAHIIEQAVIDKLLLQSAKKNNIEVSEADIKSEIQMLKNQVQLADTSANNFNDFLKKIGLKDEKQLSEKVKDKLMVIKYTQWTLEKNPEYSDTYLIAYYEKQKAIFTHPERRKVQHILVAVGNDSKPEEVNKKLAKIKAAEKKLKAGANFEKIAKEYSECESKTNGGFIGYLEVKGNENDTITKTIVKLKENELSEIVKSERGYHILKVSEIKPSYTDAFDKVKDRLKLMYLLDKHKQNAKIEYKS